MLEDIRPDYGAEASAELLALSGRQLGISPKLAVPACTDDIEEILRTCVPQPLHVVTMGEITSQMTVGDAARALWESGFVRVVSLDGNLAFTHPGLLDANGRALSSSSASRTTVLSESEVVIALQQQNVQDIVRVFALEAWFNQGRIDEIFSQLEEDKNALKGLGTTSMSDAWDAHELDVTIENLQQEAHILESRLHSQAAYIQRG